MQKKWVKISLLVLLFFLALLYMYYYRPLVDDELYGFGFGVNILKGLVPYKDFNMIITPLFSYLVAGVLGIFGEYLIVYHIIICLIIVSITYMSYKKIGWSAVIIYLLLLVYPFTGYNMFSLFLMFILLNLDDSNDKKYLILEAVIISLMILTKQVLGLLVIPSLLYSKNRKKSFLIYLGIGLLFILTLVFNESLLEFIDYCFLGMFDFSSQNNEGFNFFVVLQLVIIGYLIYELKKKKDKKIFYILGFQIMSFPIVNYPHFIISFIPVVYYLFSCNNNSYVKLFASSFTIMYFIIFSVTIMYKGDMYMYFSNSKGDTFYKGRMVSNYLESTVNEVSRIIDRYEGYRYYVLGNLSYVVKLSLDDKIDKFDLINNGNMGYDGVSRYIEEIDEYCSENKCLFILENRGEESTNQTNVDILKYVEDNYMQNIGGSIYKIYSN